MADREEIALSVQSIHSASATKWLGRELFVLKTVESSNQFVKQLAQAGARHGSTIVAEEQTGGYGRVGRNWQSEKGKNIAMSVLLRPQVPPQRTSGTAMMAALALRRAVENVTSIRASIKWPNDLMIDGKKIAGILSEMCCMGSSVDHIVLGIGVNVNMAAFDGELAETATSLYQQSGRAFNRNVLCAELITQLEDVLDAYWADGSSEVLEALMEEYAQYSNVLGKHVRVFNKTSEQTGHVLGFEESGALLLQKDDGVVVPIVSGDVSLRTM